MSHGAGATMKKNKMAKSVCFRLSLWILLSVLTAVKVMAQNSRVEISKNLNYRQPVKPLGADNYQYSTYSFNGDKVYNLKGFVAGNAEYNILSLKFNPAGPCYAVLSQKKQKNAVQIMDTWQQKEIHRFDGLLSPTAIAYSADSRRFFLADGQKLQVYETHKYEPIAQYPLPIVPSDMVCSSNGYFIAICGGNHVVVMNQETGSVRTSFEMRARVNCLRFSPDALWLDVLTSDGVLTCYDTKTFSPSRTFTGLGEARSFDIHPDGKYATILTDDRNMVFINFNDENDRARLVDEDGGVDYLRYVQDGKQQVYLSYNTVGSVKYKVLKGLIPNYKQLLAKELTARMAEWSKMRPDESEAEYHTRVNEETRMQQAMLFEQEISTRMAGDILATSNISLGSYNKETSMLSLTFDNMPQIYLTVPEKEIGSFADTKSLEFRNVIYGLTKDDHFEMTYALIYNKETGKTYEFNNLSRQSLDYLLSDDNFVPIELVQQSSMEDVKLQAIKKDVISAAQREKLISDHTHIDVSTNVVPSFDADGRRINNYKVRFGYTVDTKYSAYEDFAPGKYIIDQSHAANSMLKIVIRAFENDFQQYIREGKRVEVRMTGSADALKISGVIPYDGRYGNFDSEPYYLDGALNNITITSKTGVRTNEQLAFLRAAGVKNYIQNHLKTLQKMNSNYIYKIELSEGTGGQFRRINVEFTFVDAF